jgi:hypothetical protein
VNVRRGKGPDFAEAAEALRITTAQIFAASQAGSVLVVVYTPAEDGSMPFWRALLERDADGIMVVKGAPIEIGTPDDIQDLLEGGA